jgi:hypothetical protein
MAAVKRVKRDETQGTSLQALAAELAWIRSAGFTDSRRVDRLMMQFASMAHGSKLDSLELLGAIRSASLAIQEESRRTALAELTTRERRRAV